MPTNVLTKTYRHLKYLLTSKQRRKGTTAIFISILLGLADLVAISATVPLLVLTIDKSFLEKSSKLRWLFHKAGLATEGEFLVFLICVILLFFILKNLLGIWYQYFIKKQCTEIASSYAGKLYNKYLSRGYTDDVKSGTSVMIDKLVYYPFQLSHGIIFPFITILTESIAVILIILLFLFYNPLVFSILLFIVAPSVLLVYRFTRKKLYGLGVESDEHRSETIKGINIGLQGLQDIKFNSTEDFFISKYKTTIGKFLNTNLRSLMYQYIPSRTNELIAVLGLIVFVIYGYFFSDNVGGTRVLAALFALSVFRLMPALNKLIAALMSLKTYQRVLEENLSLENGSTTSNGQFIFNESIIIKELSYRFKGSNTKLINDIDLEIKKGDCVGIFGESGVGKSTLLKIITGVIEDYEGEVKIDNHPLNEENRKDWQGKIGYVNQNPFILNGTLKQNIALGVEEENIDEEKVVQCIKDASLDIFFDKWDENLNIELGETGALISEGQKQRVCIARALYKNINTVVLDEATSSLDAENEKQIQATINKLVRKNFTILIIAHNKSFLEICNKVYEMKEGTLNQL
jgi:ABC-type multidrug transport system fused ATPase/permease subunit